ncbi:MAG: hypothetical protein U0807_12495 [Candidatus Binatia bacterium]
MLGPKDRRVKVALLLACIAMGCFWRAYPKQVMTHADLLVAMARKGTDLVTAGAFTAETMPELTYPLERASMFVRGAEARVGSSRPASLAALGDLCERYRALVDVLDRVRRTERGDAARAVLAAPLAAVEQGGALVHAALAAERGG